MKGKLAQTTCLLFIPMTCLGDQAYISTYAANQWKEYWHIPLILSIILCVLGIGLYIAYQLRISRLKEIEEIRKNAAQDFHDELGSKLSIISMYAQLAKTQIKDSSFEANQYLNKVVNTSDSLYSSMKDLLWTLDPDKDSLQELIYQLQDFGKEIFEHSLISFSFHGPQKVQEIKLSMTLKRHILLIFKEAINNTLKHSQARTAKMNISLDKQQLSVTFKDNGQGFSEIALMGDGLRNMKARAKKINGKLMLATDEEGTVVSLTCNLKGKNIVQ